MLTRSVMQRLMALGDHIDVPEADLRDARVQPGIPITGTGRHCMSGTAPRGQPDAFMSIAHRGGCFWIDDRDLPSKATFAIVMLLCTLAETDAREACRS